MKMPYRPNYRYLWLLCYLIQYRWTLNSYLLKHLWDSRIEFTIKIRLCNADRIIRTAWLLHSGRFSFLLNAAIWRKYYELHDVAGQAVYIYIYIYMSLYHANVESRIILNISNILSANEGTTAIARYNWRNTRSTRRTISVSWATVC
jgi:hypothetical protein